MYFMSEEYHILILTNFANINYVINDCLNKNALTNYEYKITWLSNYKEADLAINNSDYHLLLVEYDIFLTFKNNDLRDIPLITLCQDYQTGIQSIRQGALDYWNLSNVNEYTVERSLRLISQQQKLTTLKSKQDNGFYRDFFDNSNDGLFSINVESNGTLSYSIVNFVYAELRGLPISEIIGKNIAETLSPLEERKYQECLFSQKVMNYEYTVQDFNQLQIWQILLVPVKNSQEAVFQIRGSARNITKEKQAITKQIRQARHRNLLRSVALKIRESLNIPQILETTVTELKTILNAERVVILQFLTNGMAEVIVEAVTPNLPSMLYRVVDRQYYNEILLYPYQENSFYAWEDVKNAGLKEQYQQFFQHYKIRADLIIPVVRRSFICDSNSVRSYSVNRVWGLLCVQQCNTTRKWTRDEIELLQQLVEQLNAALSQAELLASEVQQRQELARSNAELEQFAYIASHDLQAPLQTISNYAQLLEHRYRERLDDKADRYITHMVNAVERMRNQIEDLLEYSRVDRQQNTFRETDFRLIIKQAIANLHSEIEQNQAKIEYSDRLPSLIVDPNQFALLFQNLIGNSLKYRRSISPHIRIDAIQEQHLWQFSIKDNGIGIESKHYKRIFQIFQRLHTQEEYPGTGIGLAICQKIVQRHGGNIWLESQIECGTTFYFTIPDKIK